MIILEAVSLTYPGAAPVKALSDVSLQVKRSELIAVVGKSGCGKTSLLKIIAGLLEPNVGRVEVAGLSASEARARRKVGIIAQTPVLFPWRTVRENIGLPFELASAYGNRSEMDPVEAGVLVETCANQVGLGEFLEAFPSQLSGGMQARTAIARAFSYQPEVLLLDEPFASLDEITRLQLNEDLLSLQNRAHTTTVLVTHSLREALFLAKRIIVLSPRPGRILQVVEVPEIADRAGWRETAEFSIQCAQLRQMLEVMP